MGTQKMLYFRSWFSDDASCHHRKVHIRGHHIHSATIRSEFQFVRHFLVYDQIPRIPELMSLPSASAVLLNYDGEDDEQYTHQTSAC